MRRARTFSPRMRTAASVPNRGERKPIAVSSPSGIRAIAQNQAVMENRLMVARMAYSSGALDLISDRPRQKSRGSIRISADRKRKNATCKGWYPSDMQ